MFHCAEHEEQIRKIAEHVHDSLARGELHVEYTDGVRTDELLATMFWDHCPGQLAALLYEYDVTGDALMITRTRHSSRIDREVEQLVWTELSGDGWLSLPTIIGAAQQYVRIHASRPAGPIQNRPSLLAITRSTEAAGSIVGKRCPTTLPAITG